MKPTFIYMNNYNEQENEKRKEPWILKPISCIQESVESSKPSKEQALMSPNLAEFSYLT